MTEPLRCGSKLLHSLRGVQIVATGSYAPDLVVTNEDLVHLGVDPDWIVQRTGIRQRRHAPPEMATSDLSIEAARRCMDRAGIAPSDVDLLIVGTFTADRQLPSAACMVQDRLRLPAAAMDLTAACAGFVYSLVTAAQFVHSGASRMALVIGCDCNSRVMQPSDPKTYPLFGDGAGAVLVAPGSDEQGLLAYTLGSDGSGVEMLTKDMGGSRMPVSHAGLDAKLDMVRMDGRGVFKWAARLLCDSTREVLGQARLQLSDIDLFVFHQANLRIIELAAENLGLDRDKLVINLDRYGNTSAGSVPLALDEAVTAGRIRRGDRILMCGFGAGLAWGTAIVRW